LGAEAQRPDIGGCGRLGPEGLGPFVVAPPGQAREALLAEEEDKGIDADGVTGLGQLALDVVDGQVALAHGHNEAADPIPDGAGRLPRGFRGEEARPEGGVVAELVAEDAEGTGGVGEAARHFG
jgi:hypothetical protein